MGIFDFFRRKKEPPVPPADRTEADDAAIRARAEQYLERMRAARLPFVLIETEAGDQQASRESKFGGWPALPESEAYPIDSEGRPMFLLAQINFEEAPPLEGYPAKGLLQFYIALNDLYGMDFDQPQSQKDFAVIYFPEVGEEEMRRDFSAVESRLPNNDLMEHPLRLRFQSGDDLPSLTDARFDTLLGQLKEQWQAEDDHLQDQLHEQTTPGGHKLGGYAFFTQDDPRRNDPVSRDYLLLLQIDSLDGIMWGDSGVAHFFIHPDDLRRLDFSRVWYSWDCY